MEDRINRLINEENAGNQADTFGDRADAYYRRRPRLISLLHDLYNDYVSLSDRYTRALTKLNSHNNHPSPPPSTFEDAGSVSDAESTLSFQLQPTAVPPKQFKSVSNAVYDGAVVDASAVVAELVMRNVEYEFMKNETEAQARESGRKIELQRSLVEVLESERMVLLGENSRLVYRAEILAEERNAAFNENAFLRTRASQLAQCVMRLEEEKRGVVLGRQIEDLRRQVHALEVKGKNGSAEKCVCGASTPPPLAEVQRMGGRKWSGWWRRLRKIGAGAGPCGSSASVKESK